VAGNYMDAPAHRMAYDRDGSVGGGVSSVGVITALTSTQLQGMNSESEAVTAPPTGTRQLAIVFAIPVDLAAVFLAMSTTATVSIWTSKDTTTGVDGTWTQRVAAADYSQSAKPNYRQASSLVPFPGGTDSAEILGIRLVTTTDMASVRAFHIYGTPSISATPDRIQLWHPTLNQPLGPAYFDWGNVPRSSSADRSFRIKNTSPTRTANDIDVYVEALTPGSPSVPGMHTISDNSGSTFLPSVSVPTLAPGATSGVLILRRVVPDNAQISVWSARLGADVDTWTT
jgi:hypothetical protein